MDLILLFFTGIAIGLSGAMIPGPLTLFTISQVLKSNRFAGLKIVAGHVAIDLVFILVILFGLHGFLGSKDFLSATSAIGGLALITMGVILIVSAPGMTFLSKKADSPFNKGLFLGGIAFSLASPGFIIWWATIGVSTAVRSLLFGVSGLAMLSLGHWLADVGWYWTLSYALDKGKSYISEKMCRNIVRFFSLILIILGIQFLVSGIRSVSAQENKDDIPPGMRIEKVGDLKVLIPKGAEVRRTGKGGLVEIETVEEYTARVLDEMEQRLDKIEDNQKKLQEEIEELKKSASNSQEERSISR